MWTSRYCEERVKDPNQCDQIWRNFKSFGNFLTVYFEFGILLNLSWQILYVIGQIFIDANGPKL